VRIKTIRPAIVFAAVKPGADGSSIGDKLDKSLDLRYIAGNSRICKSFGPAVENRLSPLLMTLQRAAVVYVSSKKSRLFDGRPMARRILMKLNPSPEYAGDRPAIRGAMVYGVGCLLLVVVCSTGCHKAGDASAVPPAPVAAAPDTNQDAQAAAPVADSVQNPTHAPMAGPVVAAPDALPLVKQNGEPDLHQLDQAMLRWVMANRRAPASFAEFAATAGVAIPPPPSGKKYAFSQTMHVILVNQ
jgi:hypothetical protein